VYKGPAQRLPSLSPTGQDRPAAPLDRVVGLGRWGLSDIARHVIQRKLNPRLLNVIAPYDAASNICQALRCGGGVRQLRGQRDPVRPRADIRLAARAGAGAALQAVWRVARRRGVGGASHTHVLPPSGACHGPTASPQCLLVGSALVLTLTARRRASHGAPALFARSTHVHHCRRRRPACCRRPGPHTASPAQLNCGVPFSGHVVLSL
jgi:hypothetical protein